MATQFSGGTYVNTTFTANYRWDFLNYIKSNLITAGWTNVAQAASQGPGNFSNSVSISQANPGVVNWPSHGFLGNEKIIFQGSDSYSGATGPLPAAISANTVYYVKYVDGNNFNVSSSAGASGIDTASSGYATCYTQSTLLQSATQSNVTNPIRVRIKDNLGTCIQISVENQAGSVVGGNSTSNGASLLPGTNKIFQILATQYHFLCFYNGASAGSRDFVWSGMLYTPSFLTGVTDSGFMISNSQSDSSTTAVGCPRIQTSLSAYFWWPNFQFIYNGSLFETAGPTNFNAGPQAVLNF